MSVLLFHPAHLSLFIWVCFELKGLPTPVVGYSHYIEKIQPEERNLVLNPQIL